MKILKVLAFVPLCVLALLLMEMMTRHTVDKEENTQRLILCAVSAFCNLPVLFVHYCFPPHPKYMILRRKRFSILVHIVSGSLEFLAAVAAFVTWSTLGAENQQFKNFAMVMAGAALVGHIPSAIYQTRIVFGVRAIMLPAYILCIGLHGYCAVRLLWEPSPFWLFNTFLAFNVYAWVRVFYLAFNKLKLFPGSSYTVAVLFAGVMMGPAILGPAAILLLFAFICAFDGIYWLVSRKNTRAWNLFLTERERNTYHSEELQQLWMRLKMEEIEDDFEGLSDKEKAEKVFNAFDTDKSGLLSAKEIKELLVKWEVPEEFSDALVTYLTKRGGVGFEYFYRHMWCFGNNNWLQARSDRVDKTRKKRQRAQIVFDLIDLDGSGNIDPFELKALLFAWGVPVRDVDSYLDQYKGRQNSFPVRSKRIDIDEFRKKMRPIWRFAYFDAVGEPLKEKAWHMS